MESWRTNQNIQLTKFIIHKLAKRENYLKGLKVVELASVLAGPSAGLFLAECGATVIKIENKRTGGDVTRSWKNKKENQLKNDSAYYHSVNFFKKVIFSDFRIDQDLKKVKSLITEADVVISNFRTQQERKYGLRYNELKKLNPKLIFASINGFGADDDRVAYDLILQAESGFMSMNGNEASGPLKMPVALIDIIAGHQVKEAILLSLFKREKTGRGSKISVSLYDSAVSALVNQASNYLNSGFIPELQGSLHPNIAPYGEIFTTNDKLQVVFAIGTNQQFNKLCEILKLNSITKDINFSTNQSRVKNRKELYDVLAKKIRKLESKNLLQKCHDNSIPIGKIKKLSEVMKDDSARKLIVSKIENGRKIKYVKSNVFKIK